MSSVAAGAIVASQFGLGEDEGDDEGDAEGVGDGPSDGDGDGCGPQL